MSDKGEVSSAGERTVFVRPVHHLASDDEVKAFFAAYGEVESLERVNATKNPKAPPNAVFLTYTTVESAAHLIKARVSYGSLEGLGKYFVPKLFSCTKTEYERRQEDEKELQKRKQARDGQDGVATETPKQPKAPKSESGKRPSGANCMLKCTEIPSTMTWRDIKATLGDYLKGVAQIAFVIHEPQAAVAYVVMKTAEGASAAQKIYGDMSHPQAARLHAAIPNLFILEGDEEQTLRAKFFNLDYREQKAPAASA
ncbi:RNA-binding protein [Perkinsela sp. CCAP 1560/4]|nr:RNA-binding protein [Perkinsela sp. CCAP 1560/4]KNH06457.1 RNA-binding protein [Perkinsela sp. CCAP 1560/4]|eukprot:KNH03994.1 RNA-binding protein [Perkinsela sp. CCAP 1560/4]